MISRDFLPQSASMKFSSEIVNRHKPLSVSERWPFAVGNETSVPGEIEGVHLVFRIVPSHLIEWVLKKYIHNISINILLPGGSSARGLLPALGSDKSNFDAHRSPTEFRLLGSKPTTIELRALKLDNAQSLIQDKQDRTDAIEVSKTPHVIHICKSEIPVSGPDPKIWSIIKPDQLSLSGEIRSSWTALEMSASDRSSLHVHLYRPIAPALSSSFVSRIRGSRYFLLTDTSQLHQRPGESKRWSALMFKGSPFDIGVTSPLKEITLLREINISQTDSGKTATEHSRSDIRYRPFATQVSRSSLDNGSADINRIKSSLSDLGAGHDGSLPLTFARSMNAQSAFSSPEDIYRSPSRLEFFKRHTQPEQIDAWKIGGPEKHESHAVLPSSIDIGKLSDQVCSIIERKMKIERERRGI